jgi:hypothetical protein
LFSSPIRMVSPFVQLLEASRGLGGAQNPASSRSSKMRVRLEVQLEARGHRERMKELIHRLVPHLRRPREQRRLVLRYRLHRCAATPINSSAAEFSFPPSAIADTFVTPGLSNQGRNRPIAWPLRPDSAGSPRAQSPRRAPQGPLRGFGEKWKSCPPRGQLRARNSEWSGRGGSHGGAGRASVILLQQTRGPILP